MATQSLYRRYRPRRFNEVKGQEHVVRSLRNAVINHREGQAYLFSGPRGTGKTTSARILAKVLNCENPQDGEPCCECASCLAVERGTSYDVHELDAASNNGVDAMRDLIEKASLGTPGRHKVYILDEVHMLSKAAEAALLKTLEEPPPHVVFVLATTDPQKVSETIRSRTQHLQFHLLPMDVMEQHIRWLAGDAGIELSDEALQSVLRQGGGSARDTVSALELVASGGGEPLETTPLDEFIEAFIEHDPGRALTVVALAVQQGRDPRTLTDDIVRHLRDCFLSLMAPELVQLPVQRAEEVSALAQRMGAAAAVRAMERLGEMLVEMRHAPDPRLLLEVALVQLTHEAASNDMSVLLDRIERLEHQAKVATEYREMEARLKQAQHLSWFAKQQDAIRARERATSDLAEVTTGLEALQAELRGTESGLEALRRDHYAAGDALHERQGAFYAANAEVTRLDGTPVTKEPMTVSWNPVLAAKGGYKHFMLKEIHEQSRSITDAIRILMEYSQVDSAIVMGLGYMFLRARRWLKSEVLPKEAARTPAEYLMKAESEVFHLLADLIGEFGRPIVPVADIMAFDVGGEENPLNILCLLYTSPSPRDRTRSRMPSSA